MKKEINSISLMHSLGSKMHYDDYQQKNKKIHYQKDRLSKGGKLINRSKKYKDNKLSSLKIGLKVKKNNSS